MNNKPVILVVEDEKAISSFIAAILTSNDFHVIKAINGKEAMQSVSSSSPDLMLLDLGLPDIDGREILKLIREWSSIPIIVLTARGNEREKVEALDLGADDYITKPFGTSELLARIRTELRHSQRKIDQSITQSQKVNVGGLEIDYAKRLVSMDGQEIHLTPIEYKILVVLSKHIGKVLTHQFIVKEVWGPYVNEVQSLRVNMANIRRKLEANPAEPQFIVTEVGVGYRMVEEL